MKKILSVAVAMCLGVVSSAQGNEQVQNRNDVDIMPVSGEFAVGIGIDLGTASSFIGDMFGGFTGTNSLNQTYINNPAFGSGVSVFGKYMVSDNNAIRASFSNFGTDAVTNFEVYDDRSNDPDSTVVDKFRSNSSVTYVSAGWEWRRGKTRLRGVYGGEAIMSWQNSHNHYTYGNNLGATNLTPTTALGGVWDPTFGRITEQRNGATFGVGVRGFVGVEYFFAPKICIGTEFGWRVMLQQDGKSNTSYEKYDPFADAGNGAIVAHTETSLGGRTFSSSLDNFNTQVYFHFYF